MHRHFRPKSRSGGSRANYGNPPGADLNAIWRRKRSKVAFSSILGRFFVDFGWNFDEFRLILDDIFQEFDAVLI